jgi:hypothetical protein
MRMGLRTLATVTASVATVRVVSGTLVTSGRDTGRDTPLVVAPLGRLDTRITLVEAVSADSVAADSMVAVEEAVSMEVAVEDTAVDRLGREGLPRKPSGGALRFRNRR